MKANSVICMPKGMNPAETTALLCHGATIFSELALSALSLLSTELTSRFLLCEQAASTTCASRPESSSVFMELGQSLSPSSRSPSALADLSRSLPNSGFGKLAVDISNAQGFRTVLIGEGDQLKRELNRSSDCFIDCTKSDVAKELMQMGGAKLILCGSLSVASSLSYR
jgi:hypothetical protein